MPRPTKRPTAAKLRRWRVSILRQRAHNLGTIEAPDREAAETEAVKLFGLTEEQRKRLAVREQESRLAGRRRRADRPVTPWQQAT